MKHFTIKALLLLAGIMVGTAFAEAVNTEAVVTNVTGSATASLPGADFAMPVTVGMKLPQGSKIVTTGESSVMIQSHKGMTSTLGPKTSVVIAENNVNDEGVRTSLMDLLGGNVVSNLDPTKKEINNYGVKTPRGVAAARGTVYTTTVTSLTGNTYTVTVNTLTGTVGVTFNNQSIDVTGGLSVTTNDAGTSDPISLTDALSADTDGSVEEALEAAMAVTALVSEMSDGGDEAGEASVALDNVVKAVTTASVGSGKTAVIGKAIAIASQSAPTKAAQMVGTAVQSASQSTTNVDTVKAIAQSTSNSAAAGVALSGKTNGSTNQAIINAAIVNSGNALSQQDITNITNTTNQASQNPTAPTTPTTTPGTTPQPTTETPTIPPVDVNEIVSDSSPNP